ncbi:hypothetical protein F1559_003014 [Cyanidiococcus yangmingshanensis]|uniref:Histidine-specific methyltransferase SAM-dependent domain-containing protein n=1 Tax=Cyanidiococcus yangmingshanensis TaxID=2690220 RepID=A0A7J7IKJ1_9RHOD|nr:hypothetical protein F1559_003014 [Cyanidiococcus yangmingshanensis]
MDDDGRVRYEKVIRCEQLATAPFRFQYTVLREESSRLAHDELAEAVRSQLLGAKLNERSLPSRFFYDDTGSALYERITRTEDYYLTRCEREIFRKHGDRILDLAAGVAPGAFTELQSRSKPSAIHLIELGAGDGHKTALLLQRALERGLRVTYRPIDISERAMVACAEHVMAMLGDPENGFRWAHGREQKTQFTFHGVVGDFMECLQYILQGRKGHISPGLASGAPPATGNGADTAIDASIDEHARHLVMFIGSSIGNFDYNSAVGFCAGVRQLLRPGRDLFLIGFDLRKSHVVMQRAYSDREGITAEFNRNLLTRLNRELGANFNPAKFEHFAQFNVRLGAMESFLVATEPMRIVFQHLDKESDSSAVECKPVLELRAWESIHTEYSWKYTMEEITELMRKAGFADILASFFDPRNWFVDSVFRP